jgi:hypothetical protein
MQVYVYVTDKVYFKSPEIMVLSDYEEQSKKYYTLSGTYRISQSKFDNVNQKFSFI